MLRAGAFWVEPEPRVRVASRGSRPPVSRADCDHSPGTSAGRSLVGALHVRVRGRIREQLVWGASEGRGQERHTGEGALSDRARVFFQAEDGIRDYKVTGVQTCALPISATAGQARGFAGARRETKALCGGCEVGHPLEGPDCPLPRSRGACFLGRPWQTRDNRRSEERRVGKEGRSRWSPYH